MPRKAKNSDDTTEPAGPQKGEFIAPPEVVEVDERADALPQEEEFWRPPVRFGSVPVEKLPLGWDRRRGFRKLFPHVSLPFQVVERVAFGHPTLEPNRLFWGDNLHVMRQLPSESIDLIYIDLALLLRAAIQRHLRRPERAALVLGHLGRRDAGLPHLAQRPPLRDETPAQENREHLRSL
jgi:hypothetical protein